MSFLKVNSQQAENPGFQPIAPGEYECFISRVEVTKAKASGADMLALTYTIRKDVDQPFAGRKIFDNAVVNEKMMWKFHQLAKAIELPDGFEVPTLEDFAQMLYGKAIRVKIRNRQEVYQGEQRVREVVDSISVTLVGGQMPVNETGNDPFETEGIVVNDDDVPF